MSPEQEILTLHPPPTPHLPDLVFEKIVTKLGQQCFLYLGPILRTSKRLNRITLSNVVLKSTNLMLLCTTSSMLKEGSPARIFFNRCLIAGNWTSVYYEAGRIITNNQDVFGCLELLDCVQFRDIKCTFAYAMFQMCAGNGEKAGWILENLMKTIKQPWFEFVNEYGEELVNTILLFDPLQEDTFGPIWEYPNSPPLTPPMCVGVHTSAYYCEDCQLYNLTVRVCEML